MSMQMQTDATPAAQRGRDSSAYAKPAALSGALLQRGRARAPRLEEVPPLPRNEAAAFAPEPAAAEPLAAFRPEPEPTPAFAPALAAPLAPEKSSRFADALFAAICCAAFFATFLFFLKL
jgi:hypothetical protein